MTIKPLNLRIVCEDGTSLSVQANQFAYCSPRIDEMDHWTDYYSVEVGFIRDADGKPLAPPDDWLEYSDSGELMSNVYGYVPTEKVKNFILEHSVKRLN